MVRNFMKAPLYNQQAENVGTIELPKKIFGQTWNPDLVHQVFVSEQAQKRPASASTKTRSEVRGGGRKPWRQKGTGRARHGSRRSPLWIGGGVTHGPHKERSYAKKINKKMRRKALFVALSQKLRDNEILFLEALSLGEAKTKKGVKVLTNLSTISGFEPLREKGQRLLVLLPRNEQVTKLALRNIKQVDLREARNVNTSELLSHHYLLIPQESVSVMEKTFLTT